VISRPHVGANQRFQVRLTIGDGDDPGGTPNRSQSGSSFEVQEFQRSDDLCRVVDLDRRQPAGQTNGLGVLPTKETLFPQSRIAEYFSSVAAAQYKTNQFCASRLLRFHRG
jgi:hypothetical protein